MCPEAVSAASSAQTRPLIFFALCARSAALKSLGTALRYAACAAPRSKRAERRRRDTVTQRVEQGDKVSQLVLWHKSSVCNRQLRKLLRVTLVMLLFLRNKLLTVEGAGGNTRNALLSSQTVIS